MLDFDLLKDCYGCGACVNVCPRGAVHMTQAADGSYIPEIDEARCIGCTLCSKKCPVAAIAGEPKKPHHVDDETCVRCGLCKKVCPVSCISVE